MMIIVQFLSLLLILVNCDNNITQVTVFTNVTAGRNISYTDWCKVILLPSHLGYPWWYLKDDFWATYDIMLYGKIADAVQITAADTNTSLKYANLEIINATSNIIDQLIQSVQFTVNWGGCNTPLYIGLLNPRRPNNNDGGKCEPCICDYCQVLSIKYGKCATGVDHSSKCR